MKKLEVIIKPFKLENVKEVLTELGITGMTIMCRNGVWVTLCKMSRKRT